MTDTVGKSNKELQKGLFKKILQQLQESQYSARSHQKHLNELKKLYYRQKNAEEAKEYQETFFGFTWLGMMIPFREQKCKAQERMLDFYLKFLLNAGTDADIEKFDYPVKDLPPFYTYFMRNYFCRHSDENVMIRLRLTQMVHQILKEKHTDQFFQASKTQEKLRRALRERVQDKSQTVRAVALRCVAFLLQGNEDVDVIAERYADTIKLVRYHAEHDPCIDVRKAAFSTLVCVPGLIKSSFVVKKAFDINESVREDAFKALVRIPFSNIRTSYRARVLQWGLLQENDKIRKVVTSELIPAWIEEDTCGNDLFKLLVYLDMSRNPETAAILLRSLIPDDSEDTFEKVDLSFLNEHRVVPLESLSLEKIMYWRYLCNKFRSRPYCASKILPEPGRVLEYIESLIEVIRVETEKAKAEQKEEEFEKVLCLAELLQIAQLCEYEEGSRIAMQALLGKILRDPVLDEVVVIHSAVDTAHGIIPQDSFSNFVMEILLEIFNVDTSLPPIRTISFEECVQREDKQSMQIPERESVGEGPMEESVNPNVDGTNDAHTSDTSRSAKENSNNTSCNNGQVSSGEADPVPVSKGVDECDEDSAPPSQPPPVPTRESDIKKLKTELANMILQRHRLIGQKEAAVNANLFMEAERIVGEIKRLEVQEKEMKETIERIERNEIPTQRLPSLLTTPENVRVESRLISPILPGFSPVTRSARATPSGPPRRDSIFLNNSGSDEFGNFEGLDDTSFRLSQHLRGIVLLTRYLSWEHEISPYVKMIYDTHIFECLENEDNRVRIHAMYLICMMALVDQAEARKSMAVFLQGLSDEEDKSVVRAAFRCMVDLLIQYDFAVFKMVEGDEEELNRELPFPLNDANVTVEQMQAAFTKILDFSTRGSKEDEMKGLLLKVLAAVKLLLRGRIQDVDITSWLLDLWADPACTGTPICFNIGKWLPVFVSMSRERALEAARALLLSVREAEGAEHSDEERKEDSGKLGSFVLSNINDQDFGLIDGLTVQEDVVMMILTEINRDVAAPHVPAITRFLKFLKVDTEAAAANIRKILKDITDGLELLPAKERRTIAFVVKNLRISLEKKFGAEEGEGSPNSSSEEDGDNPNAFEEDDEDSRSDHCSQGEKC